MWPIMRNYIAYTSKGKGSEKGNAAVAAATFLGDVSEPVWGIAARARMVDIPLNERNGVRAEIGPPRIPEDWHRRTSGGRSSTDTETVLAALFRCTWDANEIVRYGA